LQACAFDAKSFAAHSINPAHAALQQSIHAVGGLAKVLKLSARQWESA
jgi:hypothetical protein